VTDFEDFLEVDAEEVEDCGCWNFVVDGF